MAVEYEKFKGGGAIIRPLPAFIEVDTFLFTVEDVFNISGLGVTLTPGIPREGFDVRVGQCLSLLHPDGNVTSTFLKSFMLGRHKINGFPIVLPQNIKREDVPAGTQVWAVTGRHPQSQG